MMAWPRRGRGLRVGSLAVQHRDAVLAYLAGCAREDLFLLDLADHLGRAQSPGEPRVELLGAWRDDELVGVASVRPSLVIDSRADADAVEAWSPYLARLDAGLVKSSTAIVDVLWTRLEDRGLRAVVDRTETAYAVEPAAMRWAEAPRGTRVRPAETSDLSALVTAARASLREESRPDPAVDDPDGFRRWVRARVPRARVVERDGHVVFTGYADVQRSEGWLVQGVYTWPDERRRGIAAAGVSALCREAFDHGAEHVQLAVVDGNRAGEGLYAHLGFTAFAGLRTVLFG